MLFFVVVFFYTESLPLTGLSPVSLEVWKMSCLRAVQPGGRGGGVVSRYTALLFCLFRSAGGLVDPLTFTGLNAVERRGVSCRKPLAGNGCFIVAQMLESCLRSGGSFTAGLHS